MRREWRNVLAALIVFPLGTGIASAQPENANVPPGSNAELVRVTLEVSWGLPQNKESVREENGSRGDSGLVLEINGGRVIEAVAWPPREGRPRGGESINETDDAPGPSLNGAWRLGKEPEGRVRVRIEAPLDGVIVVRGGDQPKFTLPLVAILEKPQHTPPQLPLWVSVERLPWDSLTVDLRDAAGGGIVAPGSDVPVSVGYNILWPESTEVTIRTTAVLHSLRGNEELGRYEPRDREVVATNRREPSTRIWAIRAPQAEGTYVLEVSASWVSASSREGSVLGRLIRRRWSAAVPNSAVRRVEFTVVDPARRATGIKREGPGHEVDIDGIDLTRSRSLRPMAVGRCPVTEPGRFAWAVPQEALIEPSRRDRLLGWIKRTGAEASRLEPANVSGLAWSALGLKVAHPDRPHRLTVKVKGGEPAALSVALIEPGGGPGLSPRLLLDACASGPPILQEGPPATFSWLVWPGTSEMVLVLVNRSTDADVRLGMVTLTEIDDEPPPGTARENRSPDARTFGLYLAGPNSLEAFGGDRPGHDALATANNLAKYLSHCGASAVVLPEQLADRAVRRALDGQADEDSTGPEQLEVIRRVLSRQGFALWMELDFTGPHALPGLPPADSPAAEERGLVRLDGHGRTNGPEYHPLNAEVREAMKRRVTQALTQRLAGPGGKNRGAGLLIRLGPGPTLLGTPDTGLDDATFARFVRESFSPETARSVPGVSETDPERFAVRSGYLAGVGRMPWLAWRGRAIAALYAELAEAARAAAPDAVLAVVTPGLDECAAGIEARRVDRAGLAPSQAWRSVGLDLPSWPSNPAAPPVFRGMVLSADALAHDLATSPDLDTLIAERPSRGLLLTVEDDAPTSATAAGSAHPAENPVESRSTSSTGAYAATSEHIWTSRVGALSLSRTGMQRAPNRGVWLTARPLGYGPADDELLGHAIAALDAQWVFLAQKAVVGQEERLRRFASVLRALPAWPAVALDFQADTNPKQFGVTIRRMGDQAQTFFEIANDSPYPISLAALVNNSGAAVIEDLGHGVRLAPTAEPGGRTLVLDLLPYGISAIRVGAPGVQLSTATPQPSELILTTMQLRFNELSSQLGRLNHGMVMAPSEPPNPGFEPDPPLPDGSPSAATNPTSGNKLETTAAMALAGWHLEPSSSGTGTVAIDAANAHQGHGCLKLAAPAAPRSVISDSFVPSAQSRLDMDVYLRASAPGTKVRVWIEGESGGRPYVRRTELTASTAWESRTVRASDVPARGLDSTRVRFELMTPGVLWIDDLHVRGEKSSRSARTNAQHMLLAALQAYREQRYADFARLAGSHWILQSASTINGRLARTNEQTRDGANGRTKR